MRRLWLVVAAAGAAVAVAAYSGSAGPGSASGPATIPAYGVFPSTTVPGSAGDPDSPLCRNDARTLARDAQLFLAHSGPEAAYPADLYYVLLRGVFTDFGAHRCDPKLLGTMLARRLAPRQRDALVAGLPRAMADAVRAALTLAGS